MQLTSLERELQVQSDALEVSVLIVIASLQIVLYFTVHELMVATPQMVVTNLPKNNETLVEPTVLKPQYKP